ncbi:Sec-independent protein translocase protein TatB [Erwinia sp. V71]|uniref:Sec-independent protein translocase protein TatB n=1 Tax=Erwinia sp. V71 TaxID=3369424 RepID=UPI003F60F5A0
MFDIGFSELLLVFVIGLVVLGPQRLPIAVRTVVGWIRALRSLASSVQNELAQELKLQELQESLRKVEQASKDSLSPELKASMEELKKSAESMKRSYLGENEKAEDEAHTIHNPVVKDAPRSHDDLTPADADAQASAPAQAPVPESVATVTEPAAGQTPVVAAPESATIKAATEAVTSAPAAPVKAPAAAPSASAPTSTTPTSGER